MENGGGMALALIATSAFTAWVLYRTLRTGKMQNNYILKDRSKQAHPVLYWLNVGLLAFGTILGPIIAVVLVRQGVGL
jgi:hypothetical protein